MTLRVQIFNERFVSRYGVDRLLLLAAAHFADRGAEVGFGCLRFEPSLFDDRSVVVAAPLPTGLDMQQTERFVTHWFCAKWLLNKPDVIVIGGWPFFELAARARAFGVRSLFIDAGAVPHDGLPGHLLPSQREVRRIRVQTLPFIDRILPISQFIRLSQTEFDRASSRGVRVVPLGADHLTMAEDDRQVPGEVVAAVRALHARDKLILLLGRFERFGYKNSACAFDILRRIHASRPDVRLLILGKPGEVEVPRDVAQKVDLVANPSDQGLLALMREVDLALSVSRWEGFNLPLVEAQEVSCPALAFRLAAHPEVIADPWFLCADEAEMAAKAAQLLSGRDRAPRRAVESLRTFRGRLPWSETLASYWDEVSHLAARSRRLAGPLRLAGERRRLVLIDLTNSARDSANSGVVAVARRLSARLIADERLDVVCVQWNSARNGYEPADSEPVLTKFGGPFDPTRSFVAEADMAVAVDRLLLDGDPLSLAPPMLLLPEVALDGDAEHRLAWARERGLTVVAILHDLIPIRHPEFCSPEVVRQFGPYIAAMLGMDAVLANSRASLVDFTHYAEERGVALSPHCEVFHLPAQFGQTPRARVGAAPGPEGETRILCVSTLEPRKNHKTLIEAVETLAARRPDRRYRLRLVGNRYGGGGDIVAAVEAAKRRGAPIEWLGVVSDEALAAEYLSAHFTVYPSFFEGFGVPIVESLWMGRPCVCSADSVMGELAREGGCLTVDVCSAAALAQALETLSFDPATHARLTKEALERPLESWDAYGKRFAAALVEPRRLRGR